MLDDYKSTAQNRAVPKVAITVINSLFNSLKAYNYESYTVTI